MLLEKLLGPRVKTKVPSNKASLSPKETLLKEINDQELLLIGKNPPMKYMKKTGRICKKKDGGFQNFINFHNLSNSVAMSGRVMA